jgi:hypothetical protein
LGCPNTPDLPSVQSDDDAKAKDKSDPPPFHAVLIGKISSRVEQVTPT